jgi:hypothetical protein
MPLPWSLWLPPRKVYRHNDERARLKRRVNELLGARFQEQKGHPDCE